MKIRMLHALAGASAAMVLSSSASAVYTGLTVELHTTVIAGGAARDVYRVYANFDAPDDYVTWVGSAEMYGYEPLNIQSRNADDSQVGSSFYNPGSGPANNLSPSSPLDPNYWGTYVTIGIADKLQGFCGDTSFMDETVISPGFGIFINGNQFMHSTATWFTYRPVDQGRADYECDEDFLLRVQIMQLSVNQGEHVRGTVAVGGLIGGPDQETFAAVDQVFNSFVPVPGGLMLFGCIGLIGARRR